MEPFYYNKMNKLQQAVYHGMLQGINALESEIIQRVRAVVDGEVKQSDPASGIFV